MKLGISITVVAVIMLTIAMLFTSGWERPPAQSTQQGYRGTGMVQVDNPRAIAAKLAAQQAPAATPAVPGGGPAAASVYKNVQVLKDLEVGQFTRLMLAMTAWVSPEQGCNYCHKEGEDLAADTLYTKVVARKMLQMTRHVNTQWKAHVGETGVTCYTCHRGQPVPANVWHATAPSRQAGGFAAQGGAQNAPVRTVGLTSLPYDGFARYFVGAQEIRVAAAEALPRDPVGQGSSILATEATYGLMFHMSGALGVNCTFCHNSQSFSKWNVSRVAAWHGIRMVRDLNVAYLDPLQSVFPSDRLGPLGDAPKANCATCHNGLSKPLAGAQMVKDHPELAAAMTAAAVPVSAPPTGTLARVLFAVGSASLSPDAQTEIQSAVKLLTGNPSLKVDLSGYADRTGNANANLELAKQRAFAVRDALKTAGVAEDRVNLKKPEFVIGGATAESRRVDINAVP
jgi:photosynthetic reaction center cytochrome c subunit